MFGIFCRLNHITNVTFLGINYFNKYYDTTTQFFVKKQYKTCFVNKLP